MFRGVVLRLTAFNAVVIAAILVASAGGTYVAVGRSLDSNQRAELIGNMDAVSGQTLEDIFQQDVFWNGEGAGEELGERELIEHEASSGNDVLVFDATGATVSAPGGQGATPAVDTTSLQKALTGQSTFGSVGTDDGTLRTYVVPVYSQAGIIGAVQVWVSDQSRQEALSALREGLFWVALAGIAVAVVGGALLSARALRPVQSAFERQRAFIGDASHQLKTPVAIVRADAEALERSSSAMVDEDKEILHDLVESSAFLSDLVNELMIVARMEGDQARPALEPVDLRAVAEDAARAMRRMADAREVTLQTDVPDHPLVVSAAITQLRLAVLALLDNAIKYNRVGGSVRVSVARDNGWATLTVADTGVGIAPDDKDRVWERFYRSAQARASSVDGAGLGLAIIREVVRQHRGHLSLTSEPGQGTTVVISLRVAE